jgi:AcrR family transcriptional regulator
LTGGRLQDLAIREQLVHQAIRLFAERGYDGTALQDVAEGVQVRKQTLLYYFPSKEALRDAVLEELLARWKDVLPGVLLAASTGLDQLDGVLDELLGFFARHPERAQVLAREVLDRPRLVAQLLRRHITPWIDVVCEYIRRGQAQGRLHADVDAESYIMHVALMLISAVASQQALGLIGPERTLRELKRIARTSLFRDTSLAAPAPAKAARHPRALPGKTRKKRQHRE